MVINFQRFQAQEMGQESADIQAGFEKLNTARPESPRSWLQRIVSELLGVGINHQNKNKNRKLLWAVLLGINHQNK